MELIHILPRKNLSRSLVQNYELYLTDEVLKHPEEYSMNVRGTSSYKILDNSLNELGSSLKLEEMDEAAAVIWPDEFVIPDSVDPQESRELMEETLSRLDEYSYLLGLRKMAVVHAATFQEYVDEMLRLSADPRIDVVGVPKVLAERFQTEQNAMDGRVTLLACAVGKGYSKCTHFLGWAGFREFVGYTDFVSIHVRSMDSRLMLVSRNLWSRANVLSHIDLENAEIPNIEVEMQRVKRGVRRYGLR